MALARFQTIAGMTAAPFLAARRTRNRVSDADRAQLAWWYVQQVDGGDRNPAQTLAERYPETSAKTWANHFTRMRSQSPALLTDAPRRGVAGGSLTEHAERLLFGDAVTVPYGWREGFEATREVYAAQFEEETFKREPRRSWYTTDAEFDAAWREWESSAVEPLDFEEHLVTRSVRRIEVVPETFEDFEDWFVRQREAGVITTTVDGSPI